MIVGPTKMKIKRVDGCIHGFCIGFKDENWRDSEMTSVHACFAAAFL